MEPKFYPVIISDEERIPSAYAIPLVLFFVALLLFIGLLQRQAELSLMAALVLIVFLGAYGWSRLSRLKLVWRMTVDKQRMFPDETFVVGLWVENAKPLPIWIRVQVAGRQDSRVFEAHGDFTGRCGLMWYQQTRFSWPAKALARGVHRLGPPIITTADIFGFFPFQSRGRTLEIIVYPRLIHLNPIDLPRRSMFGVPGTRSPVQDPIYILGTRDYQAGRPARFIHWKASARHNRLQEKIFDPAEQEKMLLVLDIGGFIAHDAPAAFEQSLEVIASLGVRLERDGKAFGFATNGVVSGTVGPFLPIAGHRQQLPHLLELLARVTMVGRSDAGEMFLKQTPISGGVGAVIFSFGIDASAAELSRYLSIRHIPTVCVVCEKSEESHSRFDTSFIQTYHIDQLRIDPGATT